MDRRRRDIFSVHPIAKRLDSHVRKNILTRMGFNIKFDGDAISLFAVLTNEAQEQAKREMCPLHTLSAWQPGGNAGKISFQIEHDASTAIYAATKI